MRILVVEDEKDLNRIIAKTLTAEGMGQLVAQEASARLGVPFGIVDLSLAPTPAVGDSVARILEAMMPQKAFTGLTRAARSRFTSQGMPPPTAGVQRKATPFALASATRSL